MLFDDFANGGNFELQWMQLHPEIRTALMYSALHGAACGTDLPRYKQVSEILIRFVCFVLILPLLAAVPTSLLLSSHVMTQRPSSS